jgi:PDZ domain-containing secreted protein
VTDAVESQIIVVDEPAESVAIVEQPFLGVGGKFLAFTVLLGLVAGVAAFAIRLPYLALEPGRTFETEEFIAVDGAETFTSPGEVSFVTVTQRRLTPFNWAISKLQDSDDIFHEDELLRGRTIDEQREENAQLMLTSQNSAIAAALGHLGFETSEPAGVVIIDVVEGGPVDGVLSRNDVITEVDGLPVVVFEDLYGYLGTQIDTSVDLVVQRLDSAPRTITVDLTRDTRGFLGVGAADDPSGTDRGAFLGEIVEGGAVEGILESGDRIVGLDSEPITSFGDLVPALMPFRAGDVAMIEAIRTGTDGTEETIVVDVELGVRILERAGLLNIATQLRDAELPFDVGFTTEDIGGPSAGLAFTITVLDVLTEGDLTGGADIVVTGTIDREGNVGPIGGVKQKAFAAKDAGAEVFIVPERNYDDAVAAVDGLRIESVTTLTEALDIIAGFGGNAGELPTNGELS